MGGTFRNQQCQRRCVEDGLPGAAENARPAFTRVVEQYHGSLEGCEAEWRLECQPSSVHVAGQVAESGAGGEKKRRGRAWLHAPSCVGRVGCWELLKVYVWRPQINRRRHLEHLRCRRLKIMRD